MPILKFAPSTTGDITAIEDASLDLSAYYQSLENLSTFLRAHDGLEIEDLNAALAAYFQSIEDLGSDLSAHSQSLEDLSASLEAAGWSREDLSMALQSAALVFSDAQASLASLGESRVDLASYSHAAGYALHDLAISLDAVIPLVLSDLGAYLAATDGTAFSSVGLHLAVVSRAPSFRSVMAQRLSSVLHEV